jgi:hypothetical protein
MTRKCLAKEHPVEKDDIVGAPGNNQIEDEGGKTQDIKQDVEPVNRESKKSDDKITMTAGDKGKSKALEVLESDRESSEPGLCFDDRISPGGNT